MSRTIAFLRGINVGGHRVTGAQLEELFRDLGLDSPKSFLASGNVVFDGAPAKKLEDTIAAGLEGALGYAVPTLLRRADEVLAIAARTPFSTAELDQATGKPQVTLLRRKPSTAARKQVLDLATVEDRLALEGRELYWLPRAGISKSELDLKTIESTLGVQTTRTLNTIQRLARKFLCGDTTP